MANQKQLEIIKQGVEIWNKWRENNSKIDLKGADLKGVNLAGADLTEAELSGADLTGADLSDTILKNCSLRYANFKNTNLNRADLCSSDLYKTNLTYSKLFMTNLNKAKLINADLSNSKLVDTKLEDADLYNVKLCKTKLFGASIKNASLVRSNLTNADIRNTNFLNTSFFDAILNNVKVTKCSLIFTNLKNVSLKGCYIFQNNFFGSNLKGADFSDAKINETNFYYSIFTRVDFTGITIKNSKFLYSTMNNLNLNGINLCCVDFSCSDICKSNLSNSNLRNAKLVNANLNKSDFCNADLSEADLRWANLSQTNFKDAQLKRIKFFNANFNYSNYYIKKTTLKKKETNNTVYCDKDAINSNNKMSVSNVHKNKDLNSDQLNKSKIFISYSRKDVDFATKLYKKLSKKGICCFFDKKSIRCGENWVNTIDKELEESNTIIAILSENYFKSSWAKLEYHAALIKAVESKSPKKYFYPILIDGNCNIPPLLQTYEIIDLSTNQKLSSNYSKIFEVLGISIFEKNRNIDNNSQQQVRRLPKINNIPSPSLSKNFVGRHDELKDLHNILINNNAKVEGVGIINGITGVGKTMLAIEYAHRFGDEYQGGIFWVDAELGISNMISVITQSIGQQVDNIENIEVQLLQLWRLLLNREKPILIILDNFPDYEPLRPWLPNCLSSVFILVTTRRRDLNYSKITLKTLNKFDSLEMLNSGERKFGNEANLLFEMLSGHPLAIELSKNFLNRRTDISIENLIYEIKRIGEVKSLSLLIDSYSDELPSKHSKEIAATFYMCFKQVSNNSTGLLYVISILSPIPIPRKLLRNILKTSSGNIFNDPLDEAILELFTLSLIELDKNNRPWMHRLTASFVRNLISNNKKVYKNVIDSTINFLNSTQDTLLIEEVIPHADILLNCKYIFPKQIINLSNFLAWHNIKRKKYRLSQTYLKKSLENSMDIFIPQHPVIKKTLADLIYVSKFLNIGLLEIEDLFQFAFDESTLNIQSQEITKLFEYISYGFGDNYKFFNNFESIENIFYQMLHSLTKIDNYLKYISLQDMAKITSFNDYIYFLISYYYFDDAFLFDLYSNNFLLKGINYQDDKLSKIIDDQDIIKDDLGKIIKINDIDIDDKFVDNWQDLKNAEKLIKSKHYEKAKKIYQKILADSNKSTFIDQSNIFSIKYEYANVLRLLKEFDEAKSILEETIGAMPEEHDLNDKLRFRQLLAAILSDLNLHEEAKSVMTSVLETAQKKFKIAGQNIPHYMHDLSAILTKKGDFESAKKISQKAYKHLLDCYGPNHHATQSSILLKEMSPKIFRFINFISESLDLDDLNLDNLNFDDFLDNMPYLFENIINIYDKNELDSIFKEMKQLLSCISFDEMLKSIFPNISKSIIDDLVLNFFQENNAHKKILAFKNFATFIKDSKKLPNK